MSNSKFNVRLLTEIAFMAALASSSALFQILFMAGLLLKSPVSQFLFSVFVAA